MTPLKELIEWMEEERKGYFNSIPMRNSTADYILEKAKQLQELEQKDGWKYPHLNELPTNGEFVRGITISDSYDGLFLYEDDKFWFISPKKLKIEISIDGKPNIICWHPIQPLPNLPKTV